MSSPRNLTKSQAINLLPHHKKKLEEYEEVLWAIIHNSTSNIVQDNCIQIIYEQYLIDFYDFIRDKK